MINYMHLLIVEDNSADAYLITELLNKGNNLDMKLVTDGSEALEYVFRRGSYKAARQPDAILLDLSLPRVSGYDVLKECKSSSAVKHIPVVIFTTSRSRSDEILCDQLGASLFMTKPHGLNEYEEVMQKLKHEVLPQLTDRIQ